MAKKEAEATTVAEVKRIVTMADGSQVDFGKRNTVLQTTDTETGIITFKVFTGETIIADLNTIEGLDYASLNELAKKFVVYGAVKKIQTTLAGIKLTEEKEVEGVKTTVNTLAVTLDKAVASLLKGDFSTRSSGGDSDEGLSDELKVFAVTAGIFEKFAFYNPAFAPAVKQVDNLYLFNDEVADEVVTAIEAAWDALDRKQRNAARRDQHFKLVEGHALQFLFNQAKA